MTSGRHLQYAGARIPYTIVRSARRTIGISVRPGTGVVVRAPQQAPLDDIERVVASRARWVAEAVTDAAARSPERRFSDGAEYRYQGRPHVLRVLTCGPAAGPAVSLEPARGAADAPAITVRVPGEPTAAAVSDALDAWLLAEARRELPQRLAACWERFGRRGEVMPTLRVRLMRSRWGSLAARSRMTLNAHLVRVSDGALDAVVYHELCHMRIDGHGPAFYAELATYVPDWRRHRTELRSLTL